MIKNDFSNIFACVKQLNFSSFRIQSASQLARLSKWEYNNFLSQLLWFASHPSSEHTSKWQWESPVSRTPPRIMSCLSSGYFHHVMSIFNFGHNVWLGKIKLVFSKDSKVFLIWASDQQHTMSSHYGVCEASSPTTFSRYT